MKDEYTACEMAYKNGKEAMRTAFLDKLAKAKGNALGRDRAILSDVIEMVEKLEVRP